MVMLPFEGSGLSTLKTQASSLNSFFGRYLSKISMFSGVKLSALGLYVMPGPVKISDGDCI